MTSALVSEEATSTDGDEIVRCVNCGTPGKWINGRVINPGPGCAPPFCRDPSRSMKLRSHGPWI